MSLLEKSFAADLSAEPAGRATLVDFGALSPMQHRAWRLLGEQGVGGAFAQPWFVGAGLRHLHDDGRPRLLVVEDPEGWLGVVPVTPQRWLGRAPMPHVAAWRHHNQFLGTPLVRAGAELRFWALALALLDQGQELAFTLSAIPGDDPVFLALKAVCAAQERPLTRLVSMERPVLRPTKCFNSGWAKAGTPKQRKRIESLARQAERDLGPLRFERRDERSSPAGWAEDFLRLEQRGWKGRTGSALADHPATAEFFREVFATGCETGAMEAVRLVAGDTVLARSTYFVDRDCAWGFKTAFDETRSRYAPGILLLREITRAAYRDGIALFDSGSAPDSEPLASLWPERRVILDCAVALGQRRRRLFATVEAARTLWARSKSVLPAPLA